MLDPLLDGLVSTMSGFTDVILSLEQRGTIPLLLVKLGAEPAVVRFVGLLSAREPVEPGSLDTEQAHTIWVPLDQLLARLAQSWVISPSSFKWYVKKYPLLRTYRRLASDSEGNRAGPRPYEWDLLTVEAWFIEGGPSRGPRSRGPRMVK